MHPDGWESPQALPFFVEKPVLDSIIEKKINLKSRDKFLYPKYAFLMTPALIRKFQQSRIPNQESAI